MRNEAFGPAPQLQSIPGLSQVGTASNSQRGVGVKCFCPLPGLLFCPGEEPERGGDSQVPVNISKQQHFVEGLGSLWLQKSKRVFGVWLQGSGGAQGGEGCVSPRQIKVVQSPAPLPCHVREPLPRRGGGCPELVWGVPGLAEWAVKEPLGMWRLRNVSSSSRLCRRAGGQGGSVPGMPLIPPWDACRHIPNPVTPQRGCGFSAVARSSLENCFLQALMLHLRYSDSYLSCCNDFNSVFTMILRPNKSSN